MRINPATLEDAFGIALVHIRSWQAAYAGILDGEFLERLSIEDRFKRWQSILQKSESQTLVARQDGGVVGFVSYGRCRDDGAPESQGEIWSLYAQPQVWGQGVGCALLEKATHELRAHGHGDVSLWVLSQNRRAIKFYEAFAFKRVPGMTKSFDFGGRQAEEVCFVQNGAPVP